METVPKETGDSDTSLQESNKFAALAVIEKNKTKSFKPRTADIDPIVVSSSPTAPAAKVTVQEPEKDLSSMSQLGDDEFYQSIYDYDLGAGDEAKLFLLHKKLATEINKIFSLSKQSNIPDSFWKPFYQAHYGKTFAQQLSLFARLLTFFSKPTGLFSKSSPDLRSGGTGNNSTASGPSVLDTTLSKSLQVTSSPLKEIHNSFVVPTILVTCFPFIRANLRTVGLFRVSGNTKRIFNLNRIFNTPPDYGADVDFADNNVFDIADVVKKYFKNMTEPIFTTQLHKYFLQILEVKDDQKIRCLQMLLMLLPRVNTMTLSYLLDLLSDVAVHEKENQMPASNLAIVFGPSLMRAESVNDTLMDQNKVNKFLLFMIQNHKSFRFETIKIENLLAPPVVTADPRRFSMSISITAQRRASKVVYNGPPPKSALRKPSIVLPIKEADDAPTPDAPTPKKLSLSDDQVRKSVGFSTECIVFGESDPLPEEEEGEEEEGEDKAKDYVSETQAFKKNILEMRHV